MRLLAIVFLLSVSTGILSFSDKAALTVSSTEFANNDFIPAKYSCEGENISPPLSVTGIPAGTRSLALILHDPDAPLKGGFTHWVMWNLDVDGTIPENFKSAQQGMNGSKMQGYTGMCPPSGTHHYHFKVYALDTRLNLNGNTGKAGLEKAMTGHILAKGELVGLYVK
jgi:Raf kinase inhibitor-like YbhB/YbcL family protein